MKRGSPLFICSIHQSGLFFEQGRNPCQIAPASGVMDFTSLEPKYNNAGRKPANGCRRRVTLS